MVIINGKPFLAYLLKYLAKQGINEVVFSVGYKSHAVVEYFGDKYAKMEIKYAIEEHTLGTGGAIKNSMPFVGHDDVFIMNGDTFFPIKLSLLYDYHVSHSSRVTLALKPMRNIERYGTVAIDARGAVTGFDEIHYHESGLINGGIYVLRRDALDDLNMPEAFSFEADYLKKYYRKEAIFGLPFDDYFIDIGVPQDYERAKAELKRIAN